MRLAVVVCFLNEAEHMPTLLASLEAQSRPPDVLLFADDGSNDGSERMAADFAAAHPYARVTRRPPRPPERDRLATAAELRAFHNGVAHLEPEWDVLAKLDADFQLAPDLFETIMARFEAEPELGIAGSYLSWRGPDGQLVRERHRTDHVRGGTKFYRRKCWEDISPLPEILGWDTIDDISARMHGWSTKSFETATGDTVHLRPAGSYDGRLRAWRRWGLCAWGFGATPTYMVASTAFRVPKAPYGIAALNYLAGYLRAALMRAPRVTGDALSYSRWEQRQRLKALFSLRGAQTRHRGDHPS